MVSTDVDSVELAAFIVAVSHRVHDDPEPFQKALATATDPNVVLAAVVKRFKKAMKSGKSSDYADAGAFLAAAWHRARVKEG